MKTLIVVCGSRTFNDKEYMREKLRELSKKHGNFIIREGGAIGADFQARMLCREEVWLQHDKTFNPKYSRYGRTAPLKRNVEMLETKPVPKIVVGFNNEVVDGGTSFTIKNAKSRGIKIYEYFGRKHDNRTSKYFGST